MGKNKQTESKKHYQYGNQSFPAVPAQKAGEELERIENKHGGLRPNIVVDESRPESAILHPIFEWDDEIAAEKHREHQASQIIRTVRVVSSTDTGERHKVPAFVSVVIDDGQDKAHRQHVSTTRAMSDADWRRGVVAEALDQLRAFSRRYRLLAGMAGLADEIDAVIERHVSS